MSFNSQSLVHVFFCAAKSRVPLGRLVFKNRRIFFEYDPSFIKSGFELSPFHLPLRSGTIASEDRVFEGLFGLFNDSLPDGWGRFLLDRKLNQIGINPMMLTPLDRLCFVGAHGMGALTYEPENPSAFNAVASDLDEIDDEIKSTLADDDTYIEDLLRLGGSSAGARPKVLLQMEESDWLIKFRSSYDPVDIGAIEYAYHLMALRAGLDLPEAKLFPSRKGLGFFGVKRFDCNQHGRVHMHTMSGLLHADHREPTLDYEMILKATAYLTRDVRETKQQFRNAVFNVLSHNRDDHAKNFSFLMDSEGVWRVSPAYDLTFSSGPAGEHSTMVMGEGKHPTLAHLIKLAAIADIDNEEAQSIIKEVRDAVHLWPEFAREAGVSSAQTQNVLKTLRSIKL